MLFVSWRYRLGEKEPAAELLREICSIYSHVKPGASEAGSWRLRGETIRVRWHAADHMGEPLRGSKLLVVGPAPLKQCETRARVEWLNPWEALGSGTIKRGEGCALYSNENECEHIAELSGVCAGSLLAGVRRPIF